MYSTRTNNGSTSAEIHIERCSDKTFAVLYFDGKEKDREEVLWADSFYSSEWRANAAMKLMERNPFHDDCLDMVDAIDKIFIGKHIGDFMGAMKLFSEKLGVKEKFLYYNDKNPWWREEEIQDLTAKLQELACDPAFPLAMKILFFGNPIYQDRTHGTVLIGNEMAQAIYVKIISSKLEEA